ncbi:MAG: GNAT superfamily N-acetyltransferase [Bacteroidia bacterium]|jgi:GNAT superfamily N-acetyltransferase
MDLKIDQATLNNSDSKAIADLINDVYAVEEAPVWKDGHLRTSEAFIIRSIEKGEIISAYLDGYLVGVVHTKQLDPSLGWFGMLVVPANLRGKGIASSLYKASEKLMLELGCVKMQCEVLIPEESVIPMKQALQNWYARLEYKLDSSCTMTDLYPHAKNDLKMACDLEIYLKDLK